VTTAARHRVVLAAVDAQSATVDSITGALILFLRQIWRALTDPYSPEQVTRFATQAGGATATARRQAAAASDAYMRTVLDVLQIPHAGSPPSIPDLPRGVPLSVEWERPVKEARRARFLGFDEQIAAERGLARAEKIATLDVALAQRDGAQSRLVLASQVTGWRRVVHPELSKGGTCGLCIAAADRVYRTSDLLPLHNRCACTVLPVTATSDPGSPVNRDALNRLYREVGGTDRQKLAKARWAVREHGELGPVLVDPADHFRGPAAVAADAPDLAATARAELASLEKALADLEARAAAGEDVSGPLAWQRDRIDHLRRLAA
jgi:hypothetical protein